MKVSTHIDEWLHKTIENTTIWVVELSNGETVYQDDGRPGTGEGAQAYGWGLYFAQLKGVAEDYKEALTTPRVLLDNKPLGDVYTADIR